MYDILYNYTTKEESTKSHDNMEDYKFDNSAYKDLKEYASKLGGAMDVRPSMMLKTAQNDVAYWSPSGSDALAEDWFIVE